MKSMLYIAFAVIVSLPVGMPSGWAQSSGHKMISPNDLKWSDIPSLPPGAKIAVIEGPLNEAVPFTFRLRFPANYQIPAHWHPAVERVTVISGTFYRGGGTNRNMRGRRALGRGRMMTIRRK